MIRAAFLLALLATPALAQRPQCGFGLGLQALREADRALRAGAAAAELMPGRAAADTAAASLAEATDRLAGCGCPQAADLARDAAGLAEQARSEATAERIRRTLDRARFSLGQAQEKLGRRGCG